MRVHIGEYIEYSDDNDPPRDTHVHIDKWDVWSLDHTLALIIHPALIKFKKNMNAHPCMQPVPDALHTEWPLPDPPCGSCNCADTWDTILDKMIWSFAQLLDDGSDDEFYSGEIDHISVPIDADDNVVDETDAIGFRWDRGPNDTFKVDMVGLTEHRKKIQEGFDLFGKHYRALWT